MASVSPPSPPEAAPPRGAFSCEVCPGKRANEDQSRGLTDGVAAATLTLMREWSSARRQPPRELDERWNPLTYVDCSALRSFLWDDGTLPLAAPRVRVLEDFVARLVDALAMSGKELVVAYVVVEQVVHRAPWTLRTYTLRPLLVGACVLAVMCCNDYHTSTTWCARKLAHLLTAVDARRLERVVMATFQNAGWWIPTQTLHDNVYMTKTERKLRRVQYEEYVGALCGAAGLPERKAAKAGACFENLHDDLR
jgi:hypothetical protein